MSVEDVVVDVADDKRILAVGLSGERGERQNGAVLEGDGNDSAILLLDGLNDAVGNGGGPNVPSLVSAVLLAVSDNGHNAVALSDLADVGVDNVIVNSLAGGGALSKNPVDNGGVLNGVGIAAGAKEA